MEISELESADYDILENIKAALYKLWKLKMVVILSTLIGLLCFFMFLSIVGNRTIYHSGAAIYSAVYGSYEDSTEGVKVMNTYASMLGTSRVCARAAETLSDPNLTPDVLIQMVRNGEIYLAGASNSSRDFGYRLTLVVESPNSNRIIDVANAMAQAFADEINDFLGYSSLQVLDPSTTYGFSNSIDVRLFSALFAAVGFFLSVFLIFIKEFLSPRISTVGQCVRNQNEILGLIPYGGKK